LHQAQVAGRNTGRRREGTRTSFPWMTRKKATCSRRHGTRSKTSNISAESVQVVDDDIDDDDDEPFTLVAAVIIDNEGRRRIRLLPLLPVSAALELLPSCLLLSTTAALSSPLLVAPPILLPLLDFVPSPLVAVAGRLLFLAFFAILLLFVLFTNE